MLAGAKWLRLLFSQLGVFESLEGFEVEAEKETQALEGLPNFLRHFQWFLEKHPFEEQLFSARSHWLLASRPRLGAQQGVRKE